MRKDKKWWLPPLSYTYVGPRQAVPTGLLQPQTVQVTKPSWGIGLSDGTPMITYGTPKDLPTQEATGGITWPERPATYDYQDIVQDIVDEQKFTTEVPSQAGIDIAAQIDSFSKFNDPTLGLGATDPNLQGITPFSTASTEMTPAQINVGLAEVDLPFFRRFPLAEQSMDQGTFDAIQHIDMIYGNESIVSDKDPSIRSAAKAITSKLPNWAISLGMKYGVPGTGFSGDRIETATRAESIKDALNNIVIMDAKTAGIPKDDLIASVVTGVNPLIQTNADQLSAAADLVSKGGKLDQDDARQMAFQQDEFRELVPQVIAKPAPRTTAAARNEVEEDEKARMRELARQQELARQVYAQLMSGRDRGEPSAREVQDAMERALQAQQSGLRSQTDRRGEVQAAMRDVGYGGSNWT